MTAQDDLMNAPKKVLIYGGGRGGGGRTPALNAKILTKLAESFHVIAIDETTPQEPKMATKGISRSTPYSKAGRSMYNIAKASKPELLTAEQRAWNEKVEEKRLAKKAGKK